MLRIMSADPMRIAREHNTLQTPKCRESEKKRGRERERD
jgi:hypothetical protein